MNDLIAGILNRAAANTDDEQRARFFSAVADEIVTTEAKHVLTALRTIEKFAENESTKRAAHDAQRMIEAVIAL